MKSLSSKVLVCTVALIALLLAVAPRVIGAGIEQATIDRLMELIPPEAESQLEIRRNEINSGWFRSSASIELIFTPIGTDAIALVMDFDIDHGPLLQTQNGLGIGLAYANIKPSIRNDLFDIAIAELSFPLPDIMADLLVRFDQSVQLDMNVSEANYSGTQGEMNFNGLNASIHVDSDQSARFVLNMGELAVTENAANSNVVVAGLAITSITSQLNDMLANSSATLSIPSLSSTAPVSFSISDIVVDYGLNVSPADPQSSEIYQSLSIANIEGGLPVRSLSWRSEIKQLKNELLQRLLPPAQRATGRIQCRPRSLFRGAAIPGARTAAHRAAEPAGDKQSYSSKRLRWRSHCGPAHRVDRTGNTGQSFRGRYQCSDSGLGYNTRHIP